MCTTGPSIEVPVRRTISACIPSYTATGAGTLVITPRAGILPVVWMAADEGRLRQSLVTLGRHRLVAPWIALRA
jgi:hypothetical protein